MKILQFREFGLILFYFTLMKKLTHTGSVQIAGGFFADLWQF